MLTDIYLPSYVGLILFLLMIFSGQAFRLNWKDKRNSWILKAWIYGVVSSTSFFILILASYEIQP